MVPTASAPPGGVNEPGGATGRIPNRGVQERFRPLAQRGAWAVGDQILSSGTNFAAAVAVARLLGPTDYGAYVVAYGGVMIALSLSRSLIVQPYVIGASTLSGEDWNRVTRSASGLALFCGLLAAAVLASIGAVIGRFTAVGIAFCAMAAVAPALLVQDFWRNAAFARSEPRWAFYNDAVWALGQAASFAVVWTLLEKSTLLVILAWGTGALAGALFGLRQFNLLPSIGREVLAWARSTAAIGGWFGLASVLYSAGGQTVAVIIAAIVGRADLGGYQSVTNLFGPSQLVTAAGQAVGLPYLTRAREGRGLSGLRRAIKGYSLIVGSVLTLYAAFVLAFGSVLLKHVFGAAYGGYSTLVVPCAVTFLFNAWASGGAVGLTSLSKARTLLGIQVVMWLFQIPLLALLTPRLGVVGAAWAAAAGAAVRFIGIWVRCHKVTGMVAPRATVAAIEL